jgi:glucosamine-6-phosphate deaminase
MIEQAEDRSMFHIHLNETKQALGNAAARVAADAIKSAIAERGQATIVVATGASQFEFLAALVGHEDIDWARVTAFHLDEYIDMPETHPASFRKYLKERFVAHLPQLGAMHLIKGDAPDLSAEIARINGLMRGRVIDVMLAGIGENGHLAFNDPPADFEATEAFKVVPLDERCRKQQFGEGWFATLDDVPREAVSMTIPQIASSRKIVLSVPDMRKAQAVQEAVEGPITPMCPASVLQGHPDCHLFLDRESSSLLHDSRRH